MWFAIDAGLLSPVQSWILIKLDISFIAFINVKQGLTWWQKEFKIKLTPFSTVNNTDISNNVILKVMIKWYLNVNILIFLSEQRLIILLVKMMDLTTNQLDFSLDDPTHVCKNTVILH